MVLWTSMTGLIGGVASSAVVKADASVRVSVSAKVAANVRVGTGGKPKAKAKKRAAATAKTVTKKTTDVRLSKEKTMKSIYSSKNVGYGAMSCLGGALPRLVSSRDF
jgi:hypothetical protein